MLTSDLVPISIATLTPDMTVGVDLYCRGNDSDQAWLYRGSDFPLHANDLDALRDRGIKKLFIDRASRACYQQYLRELAGSSADAADVSAATRATALNEVVLDVLQRTFDHSDTEEIVSVAKELGSMAADVVTRDNFAAADLLRVLHHDYATFTHSANVAYYAGMLASRLGFDKSTVEEVITGGLLHDLGKLGIANRILRKPGKLTEEEFAIVRTHPTTGFRRLAHRDDLSVGQIMMVYQHHERIDAFGYPVGLTGDQIHPWAKICAVVDVYEAVTSQRPYRTPMPRSKALEILARDSGKAFDPEIVRCWTSIIKDTMPT